MNLTRTCRRASVLLSRLLANLGVASTTLLLDHAARPASLAAGQLERAKSALTRLVGKDRAHGEPRPTRKPRGRAPVAWPPAAGATAGGGRVTSADSPAGV
jgi:hypothetical protein